MEKVFLAPAKLNLSIDILGRVTTNIFKWSMVVTSLNLFDYIHLTPRQDDQIVVTTDKNYLPKDHRNLAYQAARILQRKYQIKQGVSIFIEKHIPVAAGLGGGSSDAAAILRGLNQLWRLNLSEQYLADLSLALDEDVPYCVFSRLAHVSGQGNIVRPLQTDLKLYYVVVKPDFSVSTRHILRGLDLQKLGYRPDTRQLIKALKENNYPLLTAQVRNVLETTTGQQHPEIGYLKQKLLQFGADAAGMSGSGPTVFGLCHSYSRAKHIFNSMRGFCEQVYLLRPYQLTND
ncbi:4-(cytidine 5'-diphospho)-2-C-methyl-D-erythritol kinase [Agrilactobacillus fermenti]|uniref:4-(cytidine 5'-diphospho)-2-C-methyl-D-erythritol kinase n=1 Tax=Agrilactobacillus fermenti TaxID=2586909 RepID=UPI001E4F912E|nr:4-(cytidine 5'-diphospho)-2-C-methyl-D-erythritol kinase [Agrilactobacillus fermenti]MCD2255983.1 4-(cytidine 5'-diphospho)-2-C-methyl-D-erythritol kinase [Agrilactobacillus fermenti]